MILSHSFLPQTPPEDFAINLLNFTHQEYELNDEQVTTLVEEGSVYSDLNRPVYPHDIGCHCCPF